MLHTKNYKLNKPEESDVVNINNFNDNVDVIDDKIKQLNDTKVSKVKGKQLSTEDFTTDEKQKLLNMEKGVSKNKADISDIKQNTEDIQKVPFSTDGESIKSVPSNIKGKCSNRVVHGGESLVNLLGEKGSLKTDTDGIADGFQGRNLANVSVSNNIQNFTIQDAPSDFNVSINFIVGHQLYLSSMISSDNVNEIYYSLKGVVNSRTLSVSNVFSKVSYIFNPSELGKKAVSLFNLQSGSNYKIKDFMAIDLTACFGQGNEPTKEWCDKNIPYFENMIYPQNVELVGEGKNIFDISKSNELKGDAPNIIDNNKLNVVSDSTISKGSGIRIKVKPNTTYAFYCNVEYTDGWTNINISNPESWYGRRLPRQTPGIAQKIFTTENDEKEINIRFTKPDKSHQNSVISDIMFIEGSTLPKQYIPYQSSTFKIQTPEQYPLAKLSNGVENYVDVDNQKYYCNMKKVILDQTFDWKKTAQESTNTSVFLIKLVDSTNKENKFSSNYSVPIEGNYFQKDYEIQQLVNNIYYIRILKSKLNTDDIEGFKKWLQNNPITLLYQLKTPVILDNNEQGFYITGNLDTYPNGRILMQGYYNKNYTLADTNTITLDTELSELTSVQMYMDNPESEGDKILVSLDTKLKNSKTIELDKKYTGNVLIKGVPKYYINPNFTCNLSSNLGAEVQGIKNDQNIISKQLLSFQDQLYMLLVLQQIKNK